MIVHFVNAVWGFARFLFFTRRARTFTAARFTIFSIRLTSPCRLHLIGVALPAAAASWAAKRRALAQSANSRNKPQRRMFPGRQGRLPNASRRWKACGAISAALACVWPQHSLGGAPPPCSNCLPFRASVHFSIHGPIAGRLPAMKLRNYSRVVARRARARGENFSVCIALSTNAQHFWRQCFAQRRQSSRTSRRTTGRSPADVSGAHAQEAAAGR